MPVEYEVVVAANGRGYQVEGDGGRVVMAQDFGDRAEAYAAAEARGWVPTNDDVLARRRKVLGR